VNETRLVPQEVWEEEPVEKIEHKTVREERPVPQVKSLYPFSGQGMLMAKGEVSRSNVKYHHVFPLVLFSICAITVLKIKFRGNV
jgi:hypothetical protein